MQYIDLDLYLQPKQREALKLTEIAPVLLYGGAKGGGKSFFVRAYQVYRRMRYPNTRGIIIRKTYPELLSNHIHKFFTEYPYVREWYNKQEKTITWPNGSITEFSYLHHTDDVFNYQGREYEDISIDEITQHEEMVFKVIRSSNRTTNKNVHAQMLLTGNPGGIGHNWVKRIFIDREFEPQEDPKDFYFMAAKVDDNKALMDADPNYKQRLQDLPKDMAKAYLEGDWNIFSGQFFSEFKSFMHVIRPFIPRNMIFVGGMDWGRTAPFAFTLSALEKVFYQDISFYRMYTFLEVYGTNKSPKEWADEIKKAVRNYGISVDNIGWIRGDPAMFTKGQDTSLSIANQFSNEGIRIQPASNDRIGGWVTMHNWLSIAPDNLPYWQITENCTNLIRTIPQMIYDENNVEDLDTTLEDHAIDATRYCMKHLKWIDGRVGGVGRTKPIQRPQYTAHFIDGKEQGINPDDFAIGNKRVYYK